MKIINLGSEKVFIGEHYTYAVYLYNKPGIYGNTYQPPSFYCVLRVDDGFYVLKNNEKHTCISIEEVKKCGLNTQIIENVEDLENELKQSDT